MPAKCLLSPPGGRARPLLLEQRVHHEPDQRQRCPSPSHHVPCALQELQEPLEQVGGPGVLGRICRAKQQQVGQMSTRCGRAVDRGSGHPLQWGRPASHLCFWSLISTPCWCDPLRVGVESIHGQKVFLLKASAPGVAPREGGRSPNETNAGDRDSLVFVQPLNAHQKKPDLARELS